MDIKMKKNMDTYRLDGRGLAALRRQAGAVRHGLLEEQP